MSSGRAGNGCPAAYPAFGTKSAATLSTGYLNALEFARERVQGPDMTRMTDKSAPRVPIIRHPDVRRMLLHQKAYAEGLRALWMYAAWTQQMALLEPEGGWDRRRDFLLPLVKGYSSEKAYEVLAMSLQVLGGSGFTMDYPIEQYIRDAKIDTVYEGTTGIQAMDLFFRKIGRDLFARPIFYSRWRSSRLSVSRHFCSPAALQT